MLDSTDLPPNSKDAFLWTDYAELNALIHIDGCFSRGDLDGIFRRAKDRGLSGNRQQENDVVADGRTEDRWRLIANFQGIRKVDFGDSYPFSLSEDGDTISLEFDNSPAQRTYLGLLVASCMRNLLANRKAEVARAFEETCFKVFQKLMPSGSEIRATWAHGGEEAPYRGPLFEKMQSIASDLRCTANFKERDFKATDTGDGGIDLIAWHGMTDEREGMPISFAQCGCSRDDWRFKQLEASPSKHYRHLPTMHPWSTYYFLPLDLREIDKDWAYKSDIGEAIIVDRLRLLRISESHDLFGDMPRMAFLEELINAGVPA